MTLQSAIEAHLPTLRAEAEARMTSRVTVMRRTGEMTTDPDGFEIPEWATVHVNLPFRLVPKGQRVIAIAGVEFSEATARGDMPADTHDLADGDYLEITHGEWAETVLSILEAVKGDQRTSRRVPVVEVDRPSEWDA